MSYPFYILIVASLWFWGLFKSTFWFNRKWHLERFRAAFKIENSQRACRLSNPQSLFVPVPLIILIIHWTWKPEIRKKHLVLIYPFEICIEIVIICHAYEIHSIPFFICTMFFYTKRKMHEVKIKVNRNIWKITKYF